MITRQATELAVSPGHGGQFDAAITSRAFGTGDIRFSHTQEITTASCHTPFTLKLRHEGQYHTQVLLTDADPEKVLVFKSGSWPTQMPPEISGCFSLRILKSQASPPARSAIALTYPPGNMPGWCIVGLISVGLKTISYGTHSMRRTKVTQIYRRMATLVLSSSCSAIRLETTLRYLEIEVDDTLHTAEQIELLVVGSHLPPVVTRRSLAIDRYPDAWPPF